MFEGVLVRLLVFGAKFLAPIAPIAAVMASEVVDQIHSEVDGSGSGVGFPNRESGLHQLIWHGI